MNGARKHLSTVEQNNANRLVEAIHTGNKASVIAELENRSTKDDLTTVFAAGLAALPIAGPALQVLFEEYMPKRQQQRLFEAVAEIAEQLKKSQKKIDPELATTEEFESLLQKTLQKMKLEHRKRKRKAFQAILINALIPKEAKLADQESLYFDMVDILHEQQLYILKALHDCNFPTEKKKSGTLLGYLSVKLHTPSAIVEFLSGQLDNHSLTNNLKEELFKSPECEEKASPYLTDFGKSFLAFISSPN